MDVLGLVATAVLTKKQVMAQPDPRPLTDQQGNVQQLLLQEPIAQTVPVNPLESQLEDESTSKLFIIESYEREPNQQWYRVQDLDVPIPEIESPQFSPTVTLEGETTFGVSGVIGRGANDALVWQSSVELSLSVSFTGEDLLEVGIESGNGTAFSYIEELTFEGQLGFPGGSEDARFELSSLSYEFPIDDRASLYISISGNDLDDFNPLLGDGRTGVISEFAAENSIHELVPGAGLQLNYDLTDELSISLGYFSEDTSEPESGAGLFNGNQSAFVQLEFEPSLRGAFPQENPFLLGFTYIHTYNDSSLETEVGSLRSQIDLERPVIGNSYGISALFSPRSGWAIGGWIGLTQATVIDLGNADVLNYALTLALPDLGKKGNLLGIVIGQEPRLTGTSGFLIDSRRSDPNTSLHIEAFYSNWLSEHLSITPGLIWITAPNHNDDNPDIFVLTVRTTFEF